MGELIRILPASDAQLVPPYMGCEFAVDTRRDGTPEIVGRRGGVVYYRVVKAPAGDGRWIAEEIAEHLSGRLTAQRALGQILDGAVEIDIEDTWVVTLTAARIKQYRELTETGRTPH